MAEGMDLKKLKIADLKKELTSRGLALKGNKQDLVDRLSQYLEENGEEGMPLGQNPKTLEEPLKQSGDESVLDNGTEPSDAILTPEAEEEGDLLAQEDEPSLLDDEEDEPPIATVTKVTSPVVLQRQTIIPAQDSKPAEAEAGAQKIAIATVAAPAALTAAQKKALRAERFNTPLTEDAKKQARLEKFGGKPAATATVSAGTVPKTQAKAEPTSEALEKLKKRSERFGTAVSPVVKKTEEMDRLMKRKKRFGVITNTSSVTTTAIKRTSVAGDDAEDKKKKRAERFGLTA